MNYRSIGDISTTVNRNLHRIPADVDLIVGIPRSGLLTGSALALALNIPIITLDAFINNMEISHGGTRPIGRLSSKLPLEANHILIVDDSVRTGGTIWHAVKAVKATNFAGKHTTCAFYATRSIHEGIDICLEKVPSPRAFEWNLFHTSINECLVDIDGVLCVDPTGAENDDGANYRRFLLNAKPLMRPTTTVGVLVTSRLEKYRPETEVWLEKQAIQYDELVMLDLPNAESRRRRRAHAKFKAEIYSRYPAAHLFIESEPQQAIAIAKRTGRSVLCFPEQRLYQPGMSLKRVDSSARKFGVRGFKYAQRILRRALR